MNCEDKIKYVCVWLLISLVSWYQTKFAEFFAGKKLNIENVVSVTYLICNLMTTLDKVQKMCLKLYNFIENEELWQNNLRLPHELVWIFMNITHNLILLIHSLFKRKFLVSSFCSFLEVDDKYKDLNIHI